MVLVYIAENISFAPRDIREVQLAKAAVAAGIHTMCSVAGVNIDDIDECIIAGGFGSFMDSESACNIGLIPKELKNKITIAGNSAGSGAAISLLTGSDCGNIVDKVKYIELSAMPEFNEKFTDNMFF